MNFSSDFSHNCQSCEGWSTTGKYKTVTDEAGASALDIEVVIKSPVSLYNGTLKQTWAYGTNNSQSEVQSCQYGKSGWSCMRGTAEK